MSDIMCVCLTCCVRLSDMLQLGDFGVAATLERSRSWGHDVVRRMSMVGTPCWMAPEVRSP